MPESGVITSRKQSIVSMNGDVTEMDDRKSGEAAREVAQDDGTKSPKVSAEGRKSARLNSCSFPEAAFSNLSKQQLFPNYLSRLPPPKG
jgi:hypothetical protein